MSDRIEFKAAITVDDAGAITGMAWPFGSSDRVGDIITKGAFSNAPQTLPMLWAHDQAAVIGVWDSIQETGAGLHVKGRLLVDSVEKAREVRALVTAGAVNGLSIGFQTKQAAPRKGGGRVISALDLVEVSVVAVPAHPDARIQTIKSAKGKSMENDHVDEIEPVAALEEKFTSIETKLANLGALGSRLDKIEARFNRPGAPAIIKQEDPVDLQRKAFVEYARSGAVDAKALSVAANGAYLIPSVLLNEMQKNLVLFSPIRSVARVTQIGVGSVELPKRTANLSGAWVSETAARTESSPTYGSQTFTCYEYATFVDVSLQLLEDSQFNLEQELMRDVAEEFGRAEGAAFTNGDGTGKPTGFMNSPATASTVTAAGATITPADLIAAYHALPSFHAANAVWLMNRSTIGKIRGFTSTTGEFLWAPGTGENGLVPGNSGVLLGRPVIEVPDMVDVAPSTISVAFADMQAAYRIVDRIGVSMVRDDFTQRVNGKVRFHARRRVGGDVQNVEAIRFLKTKAS